MSTADAARLSRAPMHDHHRTSRQGENDLGPVNPSLGIQATVVLRYPSVSGSLAADVEQVSRFAEQHRLVVAKSALATVRLRSPVVPKISSQRSQ